MIAAVLIVKEIIDYLPYFIGGAPLPVFGIYNHDSKKHSVNVQIFDSNNKSLFDKTYELGDSQSEAYSVEYPEKGWKDVYEREKLFPSGDYKFVITLDGNVTKTYQGVMDAWSMVDFKIDNYGNINIEPKAA